MKWFRRHYGAGPLHLVGLLACFALAAYAVTRIFGQGGWVGIGLWFAACLIGHDLIGWPIYTLADRMLIRARDRNLGRRRPAVPWVNHVRVPTVISGVLLGMFFPLIFRFSKLGIRGQHRARRERLPHQLAPCERDSLRRIRCRLPAARTARAHRPDSGKNGAMTTTDESTSSSAAEPIDSNALRARYREERDKRLRPDGNDQYIEPTGRFAYFLDDPYAVRVDREPLFDEVTVAIIGGGFAGLVTGARLKQAGVGDVRIIEGGGDVGGAWYWNRYPGAMCDTAAMIYLPLLEETGHVPSEKYTSATEIFGHAKRIATHFGLYEKALFSTEATSIEWDEASSRWLIGTDRGDGIRARFVAMGTGPLNRPKLPGIPGIETFAGHSFHTSRWDYGYTGGDSSGSPLDKLSGKRVGIIGTGATAVQCIPHLARAAEELFVFQRTPSSIDVRNNHPIDPEWFATLEPGWQQRWLMNFTILQTGGFADEDLVKDGWTDISQRIRDRVVADMGEAGADFSPESMMRAYEASDDEKMTEIRARVDADRRGSRHG